MRVAARDCHVSFNKPKKDAVVPNASDVADAARQLVGS